jgi:glycosyltransferase involved in cell wall biosynthesis
LNRSGSVGPLQPNWRSSARFLGRRFLGRHLHPRRILYVQYTNPGCYPPLHHSSRIMANAGWDVLFLGTESFGSCTTLTLPLDPRIRLEKLIPPPKGGLLKLHYLWFCVRILWKIFWWRPAWLYASDLLSCPPALLVSLLTGMRIILHEHDSPSRKQNAFGSLLLWTRTQLARRASLNVLPNLRRAQAFREQTHASAIHVVWNCPLTQEVLFPKAPASAGTFVLHYHGNISSTLLPLSVVKSLALLPEAIVLRVVGYETVGSVGYIKQMTDTAASLGVAHRVLVAPPVCRSELLEICQKADVGLALFPTPTGPMDSYAGASNKVFDYLCCGIPVLIPDHPEWNFLCDAGVALACEQSAPESIAASVLWFHNHDQKRRSMGERGREKILEDWNYETQFEPVFRTLGGCRGASGKT